MPLLKDIIPDSKIIEKATLGRTKCTSIIKNVLAPTLNKVLVNMLKVTKFSVLIDESTDIGRNKSTCVLVRFVNPINGNINTKLLDLIELNEPDYSAEKLYSKFKKLLGNMGIPISNVIGMASDGASVMVGNNNSFASRLREDNPNALVVKCVCHTCAIIASKACIALPRAPEDLLRQVYSYLSGSSKRCTQLSEMQDYFNVRKKKFSVLRIQDGYHFTNV